MTLAALLLAGLLVPQDPARWADHPEADALSYDLSLTVDPVGRKVEGSVAYRFRAVKDIDVVRLDSLPGKDYSVRFETLDGKPLQAERHDDELWVKLPQQAAKGTKIGFRAFLSGTPPDGLYFFDTRYGEPCAFTDHFPSRARGWLPCEDAPADRAVFTLDIEVPEGFSAVGTGTGTPGESEPLPTYLLAFAAAKFARVPEGGDDRLVSHYVYEKDSAKAKNSLKHHAAWMRIMEQTFGEYPYQRYTVVQVPTRWGGMENAGNTFAAESIFDGRDGGVGTLAHEFAHMWFGDGVGYQNWEQIWLSEGFASYFGPWLDSQTGGPALAQSMSRARATWRRSREGRTLPILWNDFSNPGQVLNSNAYPKGAWVLHMLRQEVGDESFFGAIRDYYRKNRGRGVATGDLLDAFEKRAGRKLGWFFVQWLKRPSCPELKVHFGSGVVEVEQLQKSLYRFPLTLAWTGADGKDRKQSFLVDERVERIELEGAPTKAPRVDPDVQLLYREG